MLYLEPREIQNKRMECDQNLQNRKRKLSTFVPSIKFLRDTYTAIYCSSSVWPTQPFNSFIVMSAIMDSTRISGMKVIMKYLMSHALKIEQKLLSLFQFLCVRRLSDFVLLQQSPSNISQEPGGQGALGCQGAPKARGPG